MCGEQTMSGLASSTLAKLRTAFLRLLDNTPRSASHGQFENWNDMILLLDEAVEQLEILAWNCEDLPVRCPQEFPGPCRLGVSLKARPGTWPKISKPGREQRTDSEQGERILFS